MIRIISWSLFRYKPLSHFSALFTAKLVPKRCRHLLSQPYPPIPSSSPTRHLPIAHQIQYNILSSTLVLLDWQHLTRLIAPPRNNVFPWFPGATLCWFPYFMAFPSQLLYRFSPLYPWYMGRPQGSRFWLFFFFLQNSLGDIVQSRDFKQHLYPNDSKFTSTSPTACSASPLRCLLGISNNQKGLLQNFLPFSTYFHSSSSRSLLQLRKWQLHHSNSWSQQFWSRSGLLSSLHIPNLNPPITAGSTFKIYPELDYFSPSVLLLLWSEPPSSLAWQLPPLLRYRLLTTWQPDGWCWKCQVMWLLISLGGSQSPYNGPHVLKFGLPFSLTSSLPLFPTLTLLQPCWPACCSSRTGTI